MGVLTGNSLWKNAFVFSNELAMETSCRQNFEPAVPIIIAVLFPHSFILVSGEKHK
jgi:hypothetical protein